jgi:hypothetical protein
MRALILAPLLVLLAGLPAAGQPAFTRADVQGTIGWRNVHEPPYSGPYGSQGDWLHAIFAADAGASWYWTEHLRTTFDAGTNTKAWQYRSEPITVNGLQGYSSSRVGVTQTQVGLGQQYQFGHNAWFHPYLGGGALLALQHHTEEFQPSYVYDPSTRTSRLVGDYHTETTDRTVVRPFVDAGFKAYVSRKVYFVHDTRFVPGSHGLDQLAFMFGFGVDFW